MRLRLSPLIPSDLEEISSFIAAYSPRYARITLLRIRAKLIQVGHNPGIYRLRPDIAPEIRIAVDGNYLILFRIVDDMVSIERIVHGARQLSELFK